MTRSAYSLHKNINVDILRNCATCNLPNSCTERPQLNTRVLISHSDRRRTKHKIAPETVPQTAPHGLGGHGVNRRSKRNTPNYVEQAPAHASGCRANGTRSRDAARVSNHQHQRRGRLDGRRGRIDGRRRLPRAVALHVARGGAGARELAGVRVLPAAAGALELRLQGERGVEVVEFLHAAARPVLLPLVLPEVLVSSAFPVARGPLGIEIRFNRRNRAHVERVFRAIVITRPQAVQRPFFGMRAELHTEGPLHSASQ